MLSKTDILYGDLSLGQNRLTRLGHELAEWFNKGAFNYTTLEVIEQKGVTDKKKLNNLIRKHKKWELWQKERRKKSLLMTARQEKL